MMIKTSFIQNRVITSYSIHYTKLYDFFVTGNKEEDRICPCKPAIEKEIPEDGVCHCQIFCTPEFAAAKRAEESMEEAVHQHSRGLTKEECEILLTKEQLDGDEVQALIV